MTKGKDDLPTSREGRSRVESGPAFDATMRDAKGDTARMGSEGQPQEGGPRETLVDIETLSSPGQGKGALATGTQLGRYVILQLRGEGGMGVVYSAYDPNLDRRVALKLLKTEGEQSTDAGARLRREAQMLAKVSHPNVVAVHDCGTFGDTVFVEMEFVDGVTLREWAKGKTWREIVLAFIDAGRALEAVHRVGIIHRDFKPSNVLVDRQGRVRVLDFGIARTNEDDLVPLPSARVKDTGDSEDTRPMDVPPEVRSSRMVLDIAETRRGTATGTPPYMPPEQWKGVALDARADQYAFAASLFFVLYGKLPYEDPDHRKMASDKARGAVAERPKGGEVPRYVDRALVRALAYEPADRFPSMTELLAAIERDPAEKKRRTALFALLGAGALGALVFGFRYEAGRDARVCAATADRMVGVWDEEKGARVKAGILRDAKPGAEDTWSKTKKLLDAYAERWTALRVGACLESRRGPEALKDEALGARLVCLDWRRDDLRALTDVLATDTDIAHEAVKAVIGLTPVEDCEKPQLVVGLQLPREADKRAKFEALRITIAEANTRALAARYDAARPLAEQAVTEARAHGLRAAEGRALLELAEAQGGKGEHKAQVKTLEEALVAAEASRDDLAAFNALVTLTIAYGLTLGDPTMAARWEAHAGALLERIGAPDAQAAMLERARAIVARERADFHAALDHGQRALDLGIKAHGPAHLNVARAEAALGGAYFSLGRYQKALEHHERARKAYEEILGPTHPDCATPLIDMGEVHRRRGDVAGAVVMTERSLAILTPGLGPEHPQVGKMHNNLAVSLGEMARYDEARRHFELALAIRQKAYGELHPGVALALSNLSQAELEQTTEVASALTRQRCERSVEIYERVSGHDDPYLRWPLINLSEIARREKVYERALEHADRATLLVVKAGGPDHPDVAEPLNQTARVHLSAGAPDKALEVLERVIDTLTKAKRVESGTMSKAKFLFARALRASPRRADRAKRAQARKYAEEAAAHFAQVGHRPNEQEIKAWLAANQAWLASD